MYGPNFCACKTNIQDCAEDLCIYSSLVETVTVSIGTRDKNTNMIVVLWENEVRLNTCNLTACDTRIELKKATNLCFENKQYNASTKKRHVNGKMVMVSWMCHTA